VETSVKDPIPVAAVPGSARCTPALLLAMLQVSKHVSDLIFSPASYPHVEVSGRLVPVKIPESWLLTAEDTRRIAEELIGGNKEAANALQRQGSCDISYSVPGAARFRVNIFMAYATNAGNLRLQLSDLIGEKAPPPVPKKAPAKQANQDPELVIEG
jgi:twitching motility protein PilT